jgi:hypothetical protein
MFLMHFVVYLWCSSCTSTPRTSQVYLQVMHIFRGRCATTWPFETNHVFELAWFSLKSGLKGKDGLGPWKTSTALRWEGNLLQVHLHTLISFYSYLKILVRQWGLRANNDPVLVLDAKGGEIKAKANGSATTWEFWKSRVSRVRTLVLSKFSKCLFLSKVGLLLGECLIMGKGGVFESLINFSWNTFLYASTSEFDLEIGNWVWFAKTNQVVANNDPNMPNLNQNKILVLICIDVAPLYVAFCCVGINHQKGGDWKGKCALGPFLSILVIKCPTQMVMCSTKPNGGQSANQYKGMFLDLVHCFED